MREKTAQSDTTSENQTTSKIKRTYSPTTISHQIWENHTSIVAELKKTTGRKSNKNRKETQTLTQPHLYYFTTDLNLLDWGAPPPGKTLAIESC